MKRPLVWVGVSMALGAYGAAFAPDAGPWLGLLFLTSAGVMWLLFRRRIAQPLCTASLFVAVGCFLWTVHHTAVTGDPLARWAHEHRDTFVELEGSAYRPDLILPGRGYAAFLLRVDRMRYENLEWAVHGRTQVRWYAPAEPVFSGQRVRVRGTLSPELGHVNPGVQGPEDYLRRLGVHSSLSVRDQAAVKLIEDGAWWSPLYWASRIRYAEALRLKPAVPDSIYPFILAVWLGDRRDIDEERHESFVFSGTAHVLAISGVHMAILYVTIAGLLRFIVPNRPRVRAVLTLVAVFVFAFLAGARISSLRAASMIALYLLADVLDREPDVPTALAMAGIGFMAVNPQMLFDVGFLLTFSSVASLLLFREPIEEAFVRMTLGDPYRGIVSARPTWRDRIAKFFTARKGPWSEMVLAGRRFAWSTRGGMATALAVQVLPLPLVIHFFHVVPLAGPLANLVVVPLVAVVLWLSLVTTVLAFLTPVAAPLFGYALWVPVQLIVGVTQTLSSHGAYAMLTSPTIGATAAYWLAALAALGLLRRRVGRTYVAVVVVCLAACVALWTPWDPAPEVVFLDVGHGDSIFVRTPGGATVLVDAGNKDDYVDMGKRIVAPFLWANHVRRIDRLVVTHADADHIGGMAYLIRHFDVRSVVLGPEPSGHELESDLVERCAKQGIPIHRVASGNRLEFAHARIDVLHPPRKWPTKPENDASLVVKVRWPGMDVLLTGDVESRAEERLVQCNCRSVVMKAPHHASDSSSTPAFLDAVRPQLVVASGKRSLRRGMHDAVLERYKQRNIPCLRTDIHGAVRLRTDGGMLVAESERVRRGYLAP